MTLKITFLSFALAVVIGTLAAFVFVQSRVVEASLFPYAILLQVTPVVAIAPLIIIWCSDTTLALVICATLVAIFPIIANTVLGLRSVNPGLLNLFHLNRASRWQVLLRLRIPSALPCFFAGLRIASGLALIGAVVAEFVAGTGGTGAGLAYQILQAGFQLNIPRLFAALVLIALTGVALFSLMIELLSESLEGLSAAMIAELGRYRHQVFIEKLGWDVVSTSRVRDQEFDQFDHPQTRYIVAMGRQGICGCARLLPTTDAYLLKDVFAYLCSETPPSDPSVWELSRYAASAADDPQLAMKIFWSSLQCGWYLGASSVVAVTTTAMERYFVRNGVILQRLGPPQKVKGETLVAISFPAYQERGLEMLLRYHPEWLQGVPLSMAV
ncbi:ABC transporter permease subunit [Pseudomonas sp. LFS022]